MSRGVENGEVLFAGTDVVAADRADVGRLKKRASRLQRNRVRLCAHRGPESPLHEMLIVLGRGNYIRPHRHGNRSESFHVVEGQADVVLFDEAGVPLRRIPLGDYRSGRRFFLRIGKAVFHSVSVTSETFVFHETTEGPFRREATEFAAWSPGEEDVAGGLAYMADVVRRMEGSREA